MIAPAEVPIIGAGAVFEGHVALQGPARVDGVLRGPVRGPGSLWVGAEGLVEGDLELEEVVVEGRVRGHIRARRRVRLLPGARVAGTLEAPALDVAEGALLDGELRIGVGAPVQSAPATDELRTESAA